MAVFKSDQLTNIETAPAVRNPGRDYDARKRVHVFTISNVTGLVATDTIRLGALKKGYRILAMEFYCPANWLAATATISLGITGTVAKYLSAGAVGAAAVQLPAANTAALGRGAVLAADEELFATIGTAGAGSAPTGIAYVVVEFVRE